MVLSFAPQILFRGFVLSVEVHQLAVCENIVEMMCKDLEN
jgi:hypothetical protein